MDHPTLESDRLRVVIDGASGAFREIVHREAGLSLIAQPEVAARCPFMIVLEDGTTLKEWLTCTVCDQVESRKLNVKWEIGHGLSLTVRLEMDAVAGELRCGLALRNEGGVAVVAVAYPYVAGIGRLGCGAVLEEFARRGGHDGVGPYDNARPGNSDSGAREEEQRARPPYATERDELVHPYATGFLVRDPLDSLPPVVSETEGNQPIVLGLYPEGFSGSTMQFMAYSAVGRGGFYVATEDAVGKEKWLNFYRHPEGDLRLSVWHGPEEYAGCRTVAPNYATVIAALDGGSWYDAADRYKAWAVQQPWAARGPLWSQDDRCRWLLEDVGLCTFGIDPRHDRSAWLAEIDRVAGTPVMHVLGPSWPKTGCDYMNHLPGGLEDWFPACFHPANIETIRRNGDYLVPFEFDLLFGRGEGKADSEVGEISLQCTPRPTLSRDAYDFPFLCPATQFAKDLHVARDRTLVEQYQVDGVYYDISVNNVRHICTSSDHDHRVGDAVAVTQAYRDLLSETATAMREAAGSKSIPQGTEMINEQMIPFVSFYQARAAASPAAPFEAGPFRELIKNGSAEKIPLFAYVYHEFGPLRLDGWAKLSREQGDLVYFILGRTFLQGGLIELNYEFSGLEELDGNCDVASEHYYLFESRRYAIDAALAEYVGRLSRMRVGPANRYLTYGSMRRPAPMAVQGEADIQLEYFLYNCSQKQAEYEDRGTQCVPAVLQVAWSYRDESAAWLLLNIAPDERVVELEIDAPGDAQTHRLMLHRETEPPGELGPMEGRKVLTLVLPSRRPVMLEVLPISQHGRRMS